MCTLCLVWSKQVKVYQAIASNSALIVCIAGKSHASGRARYVFIVFAVPVLIGCWVFVPSLALTVKGGLSSTTQSAFS